MTLTHQNDRLVAYLDGKYSWESSPRDINSNRRLYSLETLAKVKDEAIRTWSQGNPHPLVKSDWELLQDELLELYPETDTVRVSSDRNYIRWELARDMAINARVSVVFIRRQNLVSGEWIYYIRPRLELYIGDSGFCQIFDREIEYKTMVEGKDWLLSHNPETYLSSLVDKSRQFILQAKNLITALELETNL